MSETASIDALLEKRAQYVKNIEELDAQLEDIRAKINKALGTQVEQPQAPARRATRVPRSPRGRRAAGGGPTVNDAILQSLNKQTGTSVDDVVKGVAALRKQPANRKAIGVALSQLKSKGKVTSKERGIYKLG